MTRGPAEGGTSGNLTGSRSLERSRRVLYEPRPSVDRRGSKLVVPAVVVVTAAILAVPAVPPLIGAVLTVAAAPAVVAALVVAVIVAIAGMAVTVVPVVVPVAVV